MPSITHTTAVGVFPDRLKAFKAIEDLHNAGFGDELIGFIGKEGDKSPLVETVEETRLGSTTTGAVGGGVLGGVIGAAVALLIPGVGPAIAGGILGAALGGAALGAATGGIIGALTGMGLSEEEAHYYQKEIEAGNTLVTVKAGQRYTEAQSILERNGANSRADNPIQQNSDVIAETYATPLDVSAGMPGPMGAPDMYTPEPLPALAEEQELPSDEEERNRTTK